MAARLSVTSRDSRSWLIRRTLVVAGGQHKHDAFITTYQSCENTLSIESEFLYGSVSEPAYSGSVGMTATNLPDGKLHRTQADYLISIEETLQTLIGWKDYFLGTEFGIHMVVFDNNINEVIDSVILQISEDGG